MTQTSDARREQARGNGVAHAGQFGHQTHSAPGTFEDETTTEPMPAGTVVPIDSLREGDRVNMRMVIEGHIERSDEDMFDEDHELMRAEFAVPQVITDVYRDETGREFSFDSGTSWHFPRDLYERGLHAAPDYVPAKLDDPTDPVQLRELLKQRVDIKGKVVFEAESELQRTTISSLRQYAQAVDPDVTALHLSEESFDNGTFLVVGSVTVNGDVVALDEYGKMGSLDEFEANLSTAHAHDRWLRETGEGEPGEYTIDITPREGGA